MQSKHQSLIEQRRVNHFDDNEQPPPLPVKKKHSKYTISSLFSTNQAIKELEFYVDFHEDQKIELLTQYNN